MIGNCIISIYLDFKDYKINNIHLSFREVLANIRGSLPGKGSYIKGYIIQVVCYDLL